MFQILPYASIWRLSVRPWEEKISMYADDTLLYGCYNKSVPLGAIIPSLDLSQPASLLLKKVSRFKYLGFEVQNGLSSYITNNLDPLLEWFTRLCTAWSSLPLSPIGWVNLIKMFFFFVQVFVFFLPKA